MTDKVQASRVNDTTLTKADTVALWYAVEGLRDLERAMRNEYFSKEVLEAELARVTAARRALRKVNAIRKAQEQRKPAGGAGP